jgi:hypothetical protein
MTISMTLFSKTRMMLQWQLTDVRVSEVTDKCKKLEDNNYIYNMPRTNSNADTLDSTSVLLNTYTVCKT